MQAQIAVEQDNLVIRLPKNLISQEVLAQLLSFVEFTSLSQKNPSQAQQNVLLATHYNRKWRKT